jgi:hypothetical protein
MVKGKKYKGTNNDLQNITQRTIPLICPLSLKVTDIIQVDSILINIGNMLTVVVFLVNLFLNQITIFEL